MLEDPACMGGTAHEGKVAEAKVASAFTPSQRPSGYRSMILRTYSRVSRYGGTW